jgi:hypothetical protein
VENRAVTNRHPNYRDPASLPVELRRTGVPEAARAWIEREVGERVLGWRRLPGASTSAVHAVRLSDGTVVVLRRWAWRWVLLDEPVVAQRELDALSVAGSAGLPAPHIVAADPTGVQVGDGVPVLLMTRVPGRPMRDTDLRQLAQTAASIHEVTDPRLGHDFFRWCLNELTAPPPTAHDPHLWERALQFARHRHADLPPGVHPPRLPPGQRAVVPRPGVRGRRLGARMPRTVGMRHRHLPVEPARPCWAR